MDKYSVLPYLERKWKNLRICGWLVNETKCLIVQNGSPSVMASFFLMELIFF